MKRKTVFLLFLLIPLASFPQATLKGVVIAASDEKPFAGANVSIKEKGSPAIAGFKITDAKGQYEIVYKGGKDSLIIYVSGFNIQKQEKAVAAKSQTVNFSVSSEAISLKEVKITAPKIRQKGDTITYSVDAFSDKNDRTIGDVLKKMPGIDVTESGQITYQNKPINKFYIEGNDLLQGRYGIATNNLEAKDVRNVEVLENHQPIKLLQDKLPSEYAAINLKLKDSAKGKLISNGMFGAGLPPVLLTAEVMAMYFNKNRQNITTYKGNNTGNDVSRDLNSFYSMETNDLRGGGILGVQSPSTPSINRKRYLENQVNAITMNNLWKPKQDYQLTLNLNYQNDRIDESSYARTEYYLPDNQIINIEETMSSRLKVNQLNGEIQLNGNKKEFYLNNLLKFYGGWNREHGEAFSTDSVFQDLKSPEYGISNSFKIIKTIGDKTLNINSFNGFSRQPHSLTISPPLYPEIFGTDKEKLRQDVAQSRFSSQTGASLGFDRGKWKQDYEAGFEANLQNLESELWALNPAYSSTVQNPPPDSLKNNLQWNNYELYFKPRYTYMYDDWRITLTLPVELNIIGINDRIRTDHENYRRLHFNPSFSIQYKFSAFWDGYASSSYTNSIGGLSNEYMGYILQSYRSLVRNTGNLYETARFLSSANLTYRNPLKSLFGNASITYFTTAANLLYGYDFDGILQVRQAIETPDRSQNLTGSANINQAIDAIASTVRLGATYSVLTGNQLTQSKILKYQGDSWSLTPSFSSKFRSFASLNYSFSFRKSKTSIESENSVLKPIRSITQTAQLNIFPMKKMVVNLGWEYFYNSAIEAGSRNMSFGDIGCRYTWAGMEFQLTYSNIFNAREFISSSYSSVNSYYSAYSLRPAEIILSVRMKLK
jgi:hypothetical protein